MGNLSANQRRFLEQAVTIAARTLGLRALSQHFSSLSLSELLFIHNGQGLKEDQREKTGEYDVYSASGFVGKHTETLSLQPFVVIGRKGSAGKITFAPNGGWVIDTAYYAQPLDSNRVDVEYLYYAMAGLDFTEDIISTAIPGINRTAIYRHSLPVPPSHIQKAFVAFLKATEEDALESLEELPFPLEEQRRIVAHIDALAGRIAEARGLRQGAVEEAEGLLGTAIVEVFSELRTIYHESILEDFLVDIRYGTSRKTTDDEAGTPIFRMGNIQSGKLIFNNFKYLLLNEHEASTLLLQPGDILVNRTNSAELVGKCAVYLGEGEHSFASYIIRLRLDQVRALPTLTAYYINSPIGRAYMFRERKQMTGQANVNAKTLSALPLPLPSIEQQRRIVAYLDGLQAEVERLKLLQTETAAELDALLPSVLDRAFRGEL